MDSSKSALITAAQEVENNPIVKFIHSEVQNLTEAVKETADAMIYCNSIHYVPDKEKLLSEIRKSNPKSQHFWLSKKTRSVCQLRWSGR